MAKLYQRQNPQLSRGPIIQPEKQQSIGAAIAKFGANELDRVAKETFALGHNNVVNDIIKTAYESNPTDPKKFNEMVQSGIEKSTRNLPGEMSRKIRLSAENKANALLKQIENNQINIMNAQQEKSVMTAINDLTDGGPLSMNASFSLIMDGLINRDNNMIEAGKKSWDAQHAQLSALAEVKDGRGNYVIGKESERNMYKQAQFGKDDIFRAAIERLPKDGLKTFDNDTFQDKENFMRITGIDYKTYDDWEKLIKNRRKAFDDQDKRTIRDQAYYEASKLAQIDSAAWEDIKKNGIMSKETTDAIDKAIKWGKKTGSPTAGITYFDQDEGFLAGLVELQDAISTDDGSADYNDKLLQAAAKVSVNISQMSQNGLGQEQKELLNIALSGIVSNQNFAEALDFEDSFLLSEIARGAYNDYNTSVARFTKNVMAENNIPNTPEMEERAKTLGKVARFGYRRNVEFTDRTKKALNNMAARYAAQIIGLEQAGLHDQAMAFKSEANKELIYLKYSDWIPRQEFTRLENELKAGKNAYTTIGGSVFRYKGLSQNGVILEGEF